MTTHNLDATVFVYRQGETIRCEYLQKARAMENDPAWEHVATLEPRMWIQEHYAEVERAKTDTQAVSKQP